MAGFVVGGLLVITLVKSFFSAFSLAAWGMLISGGLFAGGCIIGGFLGSSSLGLITRQRMGIAAPIVLGFGVACLLAVFGMTMRPSDFQFEGTAPPEGGTVGPIEVPRENMRVDLRVRQSIEEGSGSYQRWSFVTVELLDANKEYLFSFGGDLWQYAGYDDGYWEESDEDSETMLEFPSSGTYYVRVQTEANVPTRELGSVSVEMEERGWWGNPVPVRYGAFVAFFVAGILFVAPRVGRSQQLLSHLKKGGKVRYDGQTWRVGGHLTCTYDDWLADEWSLQPTDPGAKMPRYLEHEYEANSDWENWLISRPVDVDDLQFGGADGGGMSRQQFTEPHGDPPEEVIFEDDGYVLEDSGTARREGASFRYHNYEGPSGKFLTIESTSSESIEAVVGEDLSVSDVSIVAEENEVA